MDHALNAGAAGMAPADRGAAVSARPAWQAYQILHTAYAVLPIIAGLDKFFDRLGNWDMYLAPVVTKVTGLADHTFMMIVGVIEIVAGLLVAVAPRVGSYVVMLWLWGIIVNLLLVPGFYDIALRDFGLSLGALALGRLAAEFDHGEVLPTSHT